MKYGRTRGPRSDRRSIIIILYTYVYYVVCVCVWWTRLRRRRIKRGVLAYNYNKKSERECVCARAYIRKSPGGVVVNFNITLICKLVTVTNERRLQRE